MDNGQLLVGTDRTVFPRRRDLKRARKPRNHARGSAGPPWPHSNRGWAGGPHLQPFEEYTFTSQSLGCQQLLGFIFILRWWCGVRWRRLGLGGFPGFD
jgi:hypothetical protein